MEQLAENKRVKEILEKVKTIAVVGLSPKENRPSNMVARYLKEHGYRIVPVNPGQSEILGETCYASLEDIPFPVELVDIFRRSEEVLPFVESAIAIKADYVWMQLGIENKEAEALAMENGLEVVMNRCIKIDHQNLF